MRLFIVLATVLALNSACMSYRAAYQADLVVDDHRIGCTRLESDVDTSNLGLACIFTGIFYGGACWGYLGIPFTSDYAELRSRIRPLLAENGVEEYDLVREDVRQINVGLATDDVFVVEKNVQTCDTLRFQMPGH